MEGRRRRLRGSPSGRSAERVGESPRTTAPMPKPDATAPRSTRRRSINPTARAVVMRRVDYESAAARYRATRTVGSNVLDAWRIELVAYFEQPGYLVVTSAREPGSSRYRSPAGSEPTSRPSN